MSRFRTEESVSPERPDKLFDQISDGMLDAYLAEDATARVAVETVGGRQLSVYHWRSHGQKPR
ncbi:MAG: hypothetical protein IPG25_16435 [Proteobacteria bacterium]|nr:hypothetical protein [Pseudomonadota bacterium]